ncbi:ABC transporter permease [Litchfieldella xinjiangensis]|uniref:ABC transporter permease n=1 Tax=Litchfieldella xinjiangensis TaxID=1166948 RepID=UPI0009DFC6BE|nr:FtsX-like permease family protein [Halomonas xinjiangensis]
MRMAALGVALTALLSHYRRHPGQLAMLLLGLWVASALWSGVQAINASARDSYARAESLFSAQLDRIERRDGQPVGLDAYLDLRLTGQPVSPVLEGRITLSDGSRLDVTGIDPLTLPLDSGFRTAGGDQSLTQFLQPPYLTRVAPETHARLWPSDESTPTADNGTPLPPPQVASELPPDLLIMDIAAAQALLGRSGPSHLLVAPDTEVALPEGLRRTQAVNLAAPGQLTDSFHLNLTAMGLLALVVGLLIVHAALSLTLEQRLGLLRTLRALGVSGRALVGLLVGELLLLGLLGGGLGLLSGVWLAKWLLPDVAASLDALYDARVGQALALPGYYWLGGLAVTFGGVITAGFGTLWRAARLDVLSLGRAQAWRGQFQRQLKRMAIAGTLAWLVALGLWGWLSQLPPAEGLALGFTMIAALLLGSALWLPPLLACVASGVERALRHRPLAQWASADLQLQLPRLSVAMMALLLALSANLGVGSMVGGFRLTFLDWLDQRLVADVYLSVPDRDTGEDLAEWLVAQPEVAALLPRSRAETTLNAAKGQIPSREVAVYGITPHPSLTAHWPLKAQLDTPETAWDAFTAGDALINEQLALASGLAPGDRLELASPTGPIERRIAAVYPDYGNPRGEVTLTQADVSQRFRTAPDSFGIILAEGSAATGVDTLRERINQRFGLGRDSVIDQRDLKTQATTLFERTFAITRALTVLTLGVAGLALLTSLLAQTAQRRAQLAPLWAIGVARRPLVATGLFQLGGAACVTALLAVPLGIALAGCLVAIINVAAFGWRLPLHVFPGQIAATLGLALGAALLAALWPAWRLWRTSPRELLTEFDTQ